MLDFMAQNLDDVPAGYDETTADAPTEYKSKKTSNTARFPCVEDVLAELDQLLISPKAAA